MFLSAQVEYNIAENIYVSAGPFIRIERSPETATGGDDGRTQKLRSEFGGYPDIYYSSFRIYF